MNGIDPRALMRSIQENELDRFNEFMSMADNYLVREPINMLFRVPKEHADRFSLLFRKFLKPELRFFRRPVDGPRFTSHRMNTKKEHAKNMGYYLRST